MDTTNRRNFLKFGVATTVTTMSGVSPGKSNENVVKQSVRLEYPRQTVTKINQLKLNEPLYFRYPDTDSPCLLIKLGAQQIGGVGPEKDIVAYSQLCSHLGCAVSYHKEKKVLVCPCHFSQFDPEKSGQTVCGQATKNLPRILLDFDTASNSIFAVGVDGLIYGRQANIT